MPKTQIEKVWLGAGLLVAVLVALVGYLFFISPQRSSTSDVDTQISSAQSQNSTLQLRINSLDAQNRKLSTYRAAVKQAQLALPSTSGLPNFLRTLQSLGNATLANVTSLTVGTPVLVDPASSDAGSSTSAPTSAATSDPTASGTTAPAAPSGPQLYSLPISAQVSGTFKQLTDFLGQLQSVQPRAVLVSSVTIGGATATATGAGTGTTLDVALQVFVAPGSVAETQQLAQAATK